MYNIPYFFAGEQLGTWESVLALGTIFLLPIIIIFLIIGLLSKNKTMIKVAAATTVLWAACLFFL